MPKFSMEFDTVHKHKDGGIMATRHLVMVDAMSAVEAINEAQRQFGSVGQLSGASFREMKSDRAAVRLHHFSPSSA